MGVGYFLFNDSRAPYIDIQGGGVVAQLESITNNVKLKPSGELLWAEAWQGQPIAKNTMLFADKDSQAVITYTDGSRLILMPGSVVEIVSNDKGTFEFSVKKGKALSVPKVSTEKPVLRSEQIEEVVDPVVYVVNTPKKFTIEPGQSVPVTIRWEWTTEPRPNQELVLKVVGQSSSFQKKLGLNEREEQIQVTEAGDHNWLLYLDGELMGGGTIEKKVISVPLVHFPQGTAEVDDGKEITLGWIHQGLVDSFDLEVSLPDQSQIHQVKGDARKIHLSLPRNTPLKWRVRAVENGYNGQWSESGQLLLLSRQQNLMKKLEIEISRLESQLLLDDLPYKHQIATSGLENFEIKIKGPQEIGKGHFKFTEPGTYTVELRDPQSGISVKKKLTLRLKDIEDHPEISEGQKIKI